MFLAMSEEKRLPFAGYSSRRSDSRARRSVGSELNCTPGKWGGGGSRESPLPPFPSSLPSFFFFLREFFSRAVLSDRLEQVTLSYTIRSKNNCLRTLPVFFLWEADFKACLLVRTCVSEELLKAKTKSWGLFEPWTQYSFFFFSKCSFRYPASSGFFVPDATGLEKPLLVG